MDMPPQVLKQQVRSLAANQDLRSLQDGAALQAFGNRLPVLQAFQEFLDLERRKARRRLAATALGFLGVLLFVLIAGGALFVRFANRVDRDVRHLEAALAIARDETGALRGDTSAMKRALDEAQAALASLQSQLASMPPRGAAVDLAVVAGTLEVLQSLHVLRAEQEPLLNRLAASENEASVLEAKEREIAASTSSWNAAVRDWQRAVEELEQRRLDATARLDALRNPVPRDTEPAPASQRLFKRRRDVPPAAAATPDPQQVLAVMEVLNGIRGEYPALWARYFQLARDAEVLEADERSLNERRGALVLAGARLAQEADAWSQRHAGVQDRVAALRPTAPAP